MPSCCSRLKAWICCTVTSSWCAIHASVRPWRTQARIRLSSGLSDRRAMSAAETSTADGGCTSRRRGARVPPAARAGLGRRARAAGGAHRPRAARIVRGRRAPSTLRLQRPQSRRYAPKRAGVHGARWHARSTRPSREATMLVLTRKSNQSIMIGDDIEVSVLAIMGEKVRIGIQAPRDVPVFRKEVYLEIQDEQPAEDKGARTEVDAALRTLGDTDATND